LVEAAHAAASAGVETSAGTNLRDFSNHLASIPRRDYTTVPMIADRPDLWDAAALDAVTAYNGGPKHVWDHTDLAGGWLNGMRNTLNAQVYAFKEPNFLCVSGTHGPAHLALYDQTTWDKYQLAKIAGSNISSTWCRLRPPTIRPTSSRPTARSRRKATMSRYFSAAASCSWPATTPSGSWPIDLLPRARILTIFRSTLSPLNSLIILSPTPL
jgi:hypothetical protein